ncbi:MAG: M23 family metallopeptidase [Hyphomonas sp.]
MKQSNVKRQAVAVKRHESTKRRAEAIAAACVVVAMVGFFFFARSRAPVAATPMPVEVSHVDADFRAITPQSTSIERVGRITSSASAVDVLEVLGASQDDAKAAMAAMREISQNKAKRLSRGTLVTAFFDASTPEERLVGLSFKLDSGRTVMASRRTDGTFFATLLRARLNISHQRAAGVIKTTLADAIEDAGGSRAHARRVAALFPQDSALSEGGRPGERFDIVFETTTDERGNTLQTGELVFAAFNGEESAGSWYRFAPSDTGQTEFFDINGQAEPALLARNPLGDARITSHFGPRIHPLTGASHLHSGTDFAGRYGTPIYAAGDGIIKVMGYGNGYGRQVRIAHAHGFQTLYAHMSGFVSTLKAGDTVQQGDLIGYVGASGSATGPHLHYEVRQNGRLLNPMRFQELHARDLADAPEMLSAFQSRRQEIDILRGATLRAEVLTPQDVRLAP